MKITTTQIAKTYRSAPAPKAATEEPTGSAQTDSFTFTSPANKVGDTLLFGGLGALPVIGAGTNVMSAWATAWDDSSKEHASIRPAVGLAGAVANLVGTAAGTVGLFTGNETAKMVGLGLLGGSALAGATMVLATP